MGSGSFWNDVKEALQQIVLKFLGLLSSRKFWAAVVAIFAIVNQWHLGAITPDTAIWSIVAVIVSYTGATAYEDASRNRVS